jgi:DNA-binding transcriptional ArsR family regulator
MDEPARRAPALSIPCLIVRSGESARGGLVADAGCAPLTFPGGPWGRDTLIGGDGNDRFAFRARPATRLASNSPTIFTVLTNRSFGEILPVMLDVAVIEDPAAAEASLDPVRARLLAALAEPGSATALAARAGLTRQKANYHLRALERHGLVELVEERRKGNMIERIVRATAASYVISPTALAALAPDPDRAPDQLSARWMLALAARLVREVGELISGASAARQRLATFAIDTEIRFGSAADRAAFAEELAGTVTALVSKYHDGAAAGGRKHRLVVAVHPSITRPANDTTKE